MKTNYLRCEEVELLLCRVMGMQNYTSHKYKGLWEGLALVEQGHSISRAHEKRAMQTLKKSMLQAIDKISQMKSLPISEQDKLTMHRSVLAIDHSGADDIYAIVQDLSMVMDTYSEPKKSLAVQK